MRADPGALKRALTVATTDAFNLIHSRTIGEQLYAFGLYTSGEAAYFAPTANTEEALVRAAVGEQTTPTALRWSPCDWQYHLLGEKFFSPVNSILAQVWNEDFSEYDLDAERTFGVALAVLEDLSVTGVFGSGAQRSKLTVNLFKGDQSEEEREEWATRLNRTWRSGG